MRQQKSILPSILQSKLSAIQVLCKKHKVKYLWVFGSVLRADFNQESDIDFLYELDREQISEEDFLENFFGFYDGLKALLSREIDLIKYKSISNPYFLEEIDESKVLIYYQKGQKISI